MSHLTLDPWNRIWSRCGAICSAKPNRRAYTISSTELLPPSRTRSFGDSISSEPCGICGGHEWLWRREILAQRFLGFELFRVWLPGGEFAVAGSLGITWAQEHTGPIQTWEDLEKYPWPDPAAIDYRQLEFYEQHCR